MSRHLELPEPWYSLVKAAGSLKCLAVELGTSPRAIQYWAKGERIPSGTAQLAIDQIMAKYGVKL